MAAAETQTGVVEGLIEGAARFVGKIVYQGTALGQAENIAWRLEMAKKASEAAERYPPPFKWIFQLEAFEHETIARALSSFPLWLPGIDDIAASNQARRLQSKQTPRRRESGLNLHQTAPARRPMRRKDFTL